MEYRPLPDEEAGDETFARYVQYAFSPDEGPEVDLDEDREHPPRIRRGLYPTDGDEPVSLCASYEFTAHLRGAWLPTSGVSAVATPPEHRRKGYVGDLLRELCRECRVGQPLSVLWPFKHPFYAQFGWATSNRYLQWSAEPSALRSAAAFEGTWERVDGDAWADLDAIHEAATDGYQLALDRSEAWWRHRQVRGWQDDPYVYRWRDDEGARSEQAGAHDEGDPRAYVGYRIEGDWGDRTLAASTNHGAADREAFRNFLGFLANHDSQVTEVTFRTAVDCPLHDMVDDPAILDCELKAGPMVRIIDVPAALEALEYPAIEATLTLGLDDPLLEAVAGTYEFAVEDGHATVERLRDEPTDADARLGIGPFSQLVVGYRSAAELRTAGELDADDDAVATLDAAFPEATPYLQEGF